MRDTDGHAKSPLPLTGEAGRGGRMTKHDISGGVRTPSASPRPPPVLTPERGSRGPTPVLAAASTARFDCPASLILSSAGLRPAKDGAYRRTAAGSAGRSPSASSGQAFDTRRSRLAPGAALLRMRIGQAGAGVAREPALSVPKGARRTMTEHDISGGLHDKT